MASTGVDISSPPSGDEEKRSTTKHGLEAVGVVTAVETGDHTERRLKSRHIQLIGIGGQMTPPKKGRDGSLLHRYVCNKANKVEKVLSVPPSTWLSEEA